MTHLYVIGIEPDGPIKVGVSRNVAKILRTFQDNSHLPLKLIRKWKVNGSNIFKIEAIAHEKLIKDRLRGEWFGCNSDKAVSEIEELLEETRFGKELGSYKTKPRRAENELAWGRQIGARKAAEIRLKDSKKAIDKIKDRWPLPSKEWPTKLLLAEADRSLNTVKSRLGSRIIAQANHRAKMKRKANAKAA